MKKNLNKKGFTLIEAIVVVAIITIVTGVTVISIGSSMERYQQSAADAANRQFPEAMVLTRRNILDANNNVRIREALAGRASGYTHSADGTGSGSSSEVLGGGSAAPTETTPAATTPTETTPAATTPTETTPAATTPTETTPAATEGESGSASGGSGVGFSGRYASTSLTARALGSTGVTGFRNNSDGSVTVDVQYLGWNTGSATFTRNADGSYNCSVDNNYVIGGVIGRYSNDNTYTLTRSEMNALNRTYGITFS